MINSRIFLNFAILQQNEAFSVVSETRVKGSNWGNILTLDRVSSLRGCNNKEGDEHMTYMKVSFWILEIHTDSLTFNFSKWLFGSTIEWIGLANFPFLQENLGLGFVIVKKWCSIMLEDSFILSVICTFYSKNVILQNLHKFTTCQLSLAECEEQRWSKIFCSRWKWLDDVHG